MILNDGGEFLFSAPQFSSYTAAPSNFFLHPDEPLFGRKDYDNGAF